MTELFGLERFSQYGLTETRASEIAEKTGNKNNPVSISEEERRNILLSRL